jgi:outer membrane protein TolC
MNRHENTAPARKYSWAAVTVMLLLLSGCSTAHYRRSADKEVYRIVQQVEGRIFGQTNAFTIDTAYSARKPDEIPPTELIDSRLQTNRRVLSVEGALDLAAHISRRYQTEKERLYLTALTLTGERYQFSPQFFANSTATYNRTSAGEENGTVSSSVGVSDLLRTGGNLGASLANDLLRYYTGDPRKSVVSIISVNLMQPLLRGFGRNSPAVENLTQAERNVVYAVRNFSFFQDQFATEIVNDYFALLAQKDVIHNRYSNYMSRVQSTKRLEARAKDRERLQDVDQARQAELTAKNTYVNTLASYRNALDQYKIKLGLSLGEQVFLDDQVLRELEQTGPIPVVLNQDETYRWAVKKQLQILNAIDQFEDSKRKVRVAADRFKADLNLLANASLGSEPYPDYTTFDSKKVRWDVGLQLNLPIDRLSERNSYRATLVSFESALRNFTLTLDNLKDSIERGLRTLEQRRQNYYIQKNALELANRRVTSTTLLQQAGRAEVRDVVDSQDAQISAQNAVTSALVDYQVTRLQLMLDVGALDAARSKFWLQDHLTGFLPGSAQGAAPSDNTVKSVVPPDEFFRN